MSFLKSMLHALTRLFAPRDRDDFKHALLSDLGLKG